MRYVTHKRAEGDYQLLRDHLEGVARRAAEYAAPFGAQAQARRMGLLHDIGKYGALAQRRQVDPEHTKKCDHATAGAKVVFMECRDPAAAFAIAGHHGGLPKLGSKLETAGCLLGRVCGQADPQNDPSAWKTEIALPEVNAPQERDPFRFAFFTRMLFSCLVDADYLDTEAFMRFADAGRGCGDAMDVLLARLRAHVAPWLESPRGELGAIRNRVLAACLAGGEHAPGLFSLTVPTGGGKTIASMGFALSHAAAHGKRRVIYVIPYTSIIEQNAQVFSEILGDKNVLEHHAGVEFPEETDGECSKKQLASENWDAPIVVTTAVQFFESLFAAKTSKCRKLHNIADSVVIFDEAQMLPVAFLRPCVRAIAELVRGYGVSAVLCTATQPSLGGLIRESLPGAKVTELCPDVQGIFAALRRVTFRREGRMSDEALAAAMNERDQALCIVSTRKRAKAIYAQMTGEGCYHLSTLMTPNHRKRMLGEIRRRLSCGLPCRVVSTSLIEAGVDVDFPEVFRETAGLDSILQAAGRCNREGKRSPLESVVHVFDGEGGKNALFAPNAAATREIDRRGLDYAQPDTVTAYFEHLMAVKGADALDQRGICGLLEKLDFPEAAKEFRLIDDRTLTVYIPTRENAQDIARLRAGDMSRGVMRRLGRDAVNVYPDHFASLEHAGAIDSRRDDGYAILLDERAYSEADGLTLEPAGGGMLWG